MEPRSAERGDAIEPGRRAARDRASMEPRSAERGNLYNRATLASELFASMEPRSAERGNTGGKGKGSAAVMLQWSHAQLSVETARGAA